VSKKAIIIRNAYSHDFGGGERFPVFLAETLTSLSYEALIVSRNKTLLDFANKRDVRTIRGWWWSQQRWNGWRIILFPIYALWQFLLYQWYSHLFAKERPDVVHIQSKDDFIAATYAARRRNIPVIWTDHADLKHVWRNITAPIKNPIGKWVYKAAQKANAITLVSRSELSEVGAHLPTGSPVKDKLRVVYNGCADVLANYPQTNKNNRLTYIIASRLVTDKGIGEAIEAFDAVHKKHPNTQLVIAGDGPERDKFTTQAKANDAIAFIGHQADPYSAIANADIFLQPTYHEGFSVVLVEASMLEKPIIATAVGGNVEIIKDNDTGLLVPAKNTKLLCSAMEQLYNDPGLRRGLARNARSQYERKFTFDTIVKEGFIPLYETTR